MGESWTLRALGFVPLGFESLGPHLLIVVWGLPWISFASRTKLIVRSDRDVYQCLEQMNDEATLISGINEENGAFLTQGGTKQVIYHPAIRPG